MLWARYLPGTIDRYGKSNKPAAVRWAVEGAIADDRRADEAVAAGKAAIMRYVAVDTDTVGPEPQKIGVVTVSRGHSLNRLLLPLQPGLERRIARIAPLLGRLLRVPYELPEGAVKVSGWVTTTLGDLTTVYKRAIDGLVPGERPWTVEPDPARLIALAVPACLTGAGLVREGDPQWYDIGEGTVPPRSQLYMGPVVQPT